MNLKRLYPSDILSSPERGIQELMTNSRDHGGAELIKVSLDMGEDEIRAIIEDDGRGFGTGKLVLNANSSQALGLSTLQERLGLINGTLQIDQSVSGQGAQIEICIPAGPDVQDAPEYKEIITE